MTATTSSRWWLIRLGIIALALTSLGASAQSSGGLVTGFFSGLVFNRASNTFNSVLTLTNKGPTLSAPLTICISTGNASVTIKGATRLDGNSFAVPVTLPGGSLPSGQSVQMVVAFADPARVSFVPTITPPPPVQPLYDPTSTVTASIDSTGGSMSITTPTGLATLTVPPNSLVSATSISMTPIIGFTGNSPSGWLAGIRLEPSGLQLLRPASLAFQLSSPPNPNSAAAYVFQDDGSSLHEDIAAVSNTTATVQLTHFTGYGVGSPSCSAPPPYDPTATFEEVATSAIAYASNCITDPATRDATINGVLTVWVNAVILPGLQQAVAVPELFAAERQWRAWEADLQLLEIYPGALNGLADLDSSARTEFLTDVTSIRELLLNLCTCAQIRAGPNTVAEAGAWLANLGVIAQSEGSDAVSAADIHTCQVLTLVAAANPETGAVSIGYQPLTLTQPSVSLHAGQETSVDNVFNTSQIPSGANLTCPSADPTVATCDGAFITGVSRGNTTLTFDASQCQQPPVTPPPPVRVNVCGLNGTWQGSYSGQTISCAERNSNGCCIKRGGVKVLNGSISVTFTQNGTSIATDTPWEQLTGTDNNGTVTAETSVPAYCGTIEVPAGIGGFISPDCSTFSGIFYVDRGRTKTGEFTVTYVGR